MQTTAVTDDFPEQGWTKLEGTTRKEIYTLLCITLPIPIKNLYVMNSDIKAQIQKEQQRSLSIVIF